MAKKFNEKDSIIAKPGGIFSAKNVSCKNPYIVIEKNSNVLVQYLLYIYICNRSDLAL